ncbi:MAG: hypothetical protein FWJ70_13230 [Micromonosporaceae bacterium]|jgi:hypothetical protein
MAEPGRTAPVSGAPARHRAVRTSPRRPPVPVPLRVTAAAAVALAAAWLAAPPMGTDLAAQVARADFFAAHGWTPVDLRWYGGVSPLGYSLLSPPLMAWAGPRPVGAAAAVVSALALVELLRRTGARRPALGGVLGAVAFTGNLVSGRVTFAVGVALGLLALLALVAVPARPRAARPVVAAGLAAAAAAASPVAGLFVGLAGVALLAAGATDGRLRAPGGRTLAGGVALAVGAAVPMAAMAGLFGTGGWMNISVGDTVRAAGASLAVAALVPVRQIRVGALLSAGGVLAAYLLTTPVGLNATRLAAMFALPLVAAYATAPAWLPGRVRALPAAAWLAPALVLLAAWQPPVVYGDLARAGDPTAREAYYAPLRAELARRQPTGRVEVVPTANYWESAYLGDVPLARGWLRQADTARNPLFFDGTLDAESYRRWLADNGVTHVAVPASPPSWVGRREAELVRAGLPYLRPVWRGGDWTLYEVVGATGLVDGPAVVAGHRAHAVELTVTAPGDVLLRVRWSPYLTVSGPAGACLARAGEWTTLRAPAPGRYEVGSAVRDAGPRC